MPYRHFKIKFNCVVGDETACKLYRNVANAISCREAEKLLRDGKYTVGEVARRCGFENLSYFTRTYKTIIGHTPTASRSSDEQ